MFIHYRTAGFILKKVDRGEADQLLTIYTKDFGKLEILAKAVRKIFSKLKSGAEIFYLSEIEFIQGKTRKTLTDAILIEKFENLRKDLKRIKIAYKISEFLDNLISGQEPDEKIWRLLLETFNKLNTEYKIKDIRYPSVAKGGEERMFFEYKIYYYFVWNFLLILGYSPELYSCVLCQKNLSTEHIKRLCASVLDRAQGNLCSGLVPGKLFFSAKEGGVICQKCFKELKLDKSSRQIWREGKEITTETIKILRIILEKDWTLFSKLKIEKPNLKSLNKITREYYSYIRPCSRAKLSTG